MIILTETGVLGLKAAGDVAPQPLWEGIAVCAAELRDGFVAISADGKLIVGRGGTLRSFDTGLSSLPTSLLVLVEDPLDLLIGAEPPYLFRWSETAGLRRNESFAALACRDTWTTPWGGPAAVRSLASPDGRAVYADIHVGSIMRSLDGGTTWEPVTPTLNVDVHRVAACPAAPERVYANTARAVYVGDDRGESWSTRGDGLAHAYGREIAVHPEQPDVLLATISDGPHGADVHGRLLASLDAGLSWQPVTGDFPGSVPENIDTHHVAYDLSGTAWACVGPGLYRSDDRGLGWVRHCQLSAPIRLLHVRAACSQ